MSQSRNTVALSDALYELSLAQQIPDAALLDEMTRRYPEHAGALTDFAIELAVDSLREISQEDEPRADLPADELSPAISRAMSRFYNRLHAVRNSEMISAEKGVPTTEIPPNPFATLDRAAFRRLVERLNVNNVFAIKLRDRQIVPETIPNRFNDLLALELKVPLGALINHLNARSQSQMPMQYYKATNKPNLDARQTFSDAVKTSGLTEEQQRFLLKF
jgi:hypothetical protein